VKVRMLISFSGDGGVEKMAINLMQGMLELGREVEVLRIKSQGRFVKHIPAPVKVIQLPASHNYLNIPFLCKYLHKKRPGSILAFKERAIVSLAIAKRITGSKVKIIGRMGTTLTQSLKERNRSPLYIFLRTFLLRWAMKQTHRIVAVSRGVKEDLLSMSPSLREKVLCIPNPTITRELFEMSLSPVEEEWFGPNRDIKVAVAMGRLTTQKDFQTLISAIYLVNKSIPLRLFIMGEGEKRAQLQEQINKLGLNQRIKLAGFISNPYPYIANADLFVLSSRWEGSPNALTEALALGTPVVSTDCKSGPREILQDGRLGPLVEVGEPSSLAEAILKVIRDPLPPQVLKKGVGDYYYLTSARKYLSLLSP